MGVGVGGWVGGWGCVGVCVLRWVIRVTSYYFNCLITSEYLMSCLFQFHVIDLSFSRLAACNHSYTDIQSYEFSGVIDLDLSNVLHYMQTNIQFKMEM